MKYILSYRLENNRITKIYLIDLYNEIEYHKLQWGNIQREFNENWFPFKDPFFYVTEDIFKKILPLKGDDFYNSNFVSFLKKNQLEEFLI